MMLQSKMKVLVTVTNAKYISGKTLELTFSDGVKAEVDFSHWIEKYSFFDPLKDTGYFQNFSLDGWTVAWPNGADIAPETLHEVAVNSQQTQVT